VYFYISLCSYINPDHNILTGYGPTPPSEQSNHWKVDMWLSVKLVVAQLQLQCQFLRASCSASSFMPIAAPVAVPIIVPVAVPIIVLVAVPTPVAVLVVVKVSVKYWD
jgi:hypothetical protein